MVTVVDDTGSATLATSLGRNPHFEDGKALKSAQVVIIAWPLSSRDVSATSRTLTSVKMRAPN